MIAAQSGTTFVRIEKRFGTSEAKRLRDMLALIAPIRHITIDFTNAEHIEDAALSVVAQMLTTNPEARFRLEGLNHHRRRLLGYMGVREPGQAAT